jgi:hypothetical protein
MARRAQRTVLRELASHLFRQLGGDQWANAEKANEDGPNRLLGLRRIISNKRPTLGADLAMHVAYMATAPYSRRVSWFVRVMSERIRHPVDPWIGELALRVASRPMSVEQWAGTQFNDGITKILFWQTLTRAARFLVLAVEQHLNSTSTADELYAGWSWK